MGRLIVIEGVDSSGKATQANLLYTYLKSRDDKVIKVEFPDYESPSSSVIKMYLNGDFGKNPNDLSPYIASTFFAVDRFASYKTKWEHLYNEGYTVIADRYVTANMMHQASKIEDKEQKKEFLEWLYDFEYKKFGLPVPDLAFFLDVPPEISFKLMENRLNKYSNEMKKDIHESNKIYLTDTYHNAKYIAENFGFVTIDCVNGNSLKSIDEIHNEITRKVEEFLK